MKIKCLKQDGNTYITPGKIYQVLETVGSMYAIINNNGVRHEYMTELFQVVPEEVEEEPAPAPTPPTVVPAPTPPSPPPFDFNAYNSLAGLPGRHYS